MQKTHVVLLTSACYLIASRIPPGLGSEALRLGLEAPGLKARGCRAVLQEGDWRRARRRKATMGQDQENYQ